MQKQLSHCFNAAKLFLTDKIVLEVSGGEIMLVTDIQLAEMENQALEFDGFYPWIVKGYLATMSINNPNTLQNAFEYLKKHGIDIFSRTDGHYLTALHIAAGHHVPEAWENVIKLLPEYNEILYHANTLTDEQFRNYWNEFTKNG